MQITRISFARNNNANNFKMNKNQSPIQPAAQTALAWFGFGVGLDFVSRKCSFFKSPAKNSLFINSMLACLAGGYTFFKTFTNKNQNLIKKG